MIRLIQTGGLELLRRAKAYSKDTRRSPWEFSVEVDALVRGGLSVTDLRWLIAKRYAEHAAEKTRLSDHARQFRAVEALILPPGTCLVLTDAGFEAVNALVSASDDGSRDARTALGASNPSVAKRRRRSSGPIWDPGLHELRMGARSIKRFARPAPSQELILAAFEEEGWPEMIDDPLPMDYEQDAKRRLHYTVHHLNHGQQPHLIRFYVNGGGQRIYWRSTREIRE